ncbi:ArnT family glycosyltransferase [Amycolatopsis sp. CA-230715]|uniref:ArnT family glycosyltransferase n=1 Tax=Amycolatopsis sp. CA-230715 TaxID=2745196 RepID=UPI001C01B2D1|nr:glycosyltransferase family 39 protein [Amycolatopsis sp. CA-230715]QWF79408.1 hypothetical protein HUW46_02816 [Amycolatopsis sp. CA-230715]
MNVTGTAIGADTEPAARGTATKFFRWQVCTVSGVVAALLLALSGRGSYHIDELYFRVSGQHLDWAYVDQPLLVPLLARVQTELFGDTLVATRVIPALLFGVTMVVAALIAREFGGGAKAQLLASCATAASVIPLGIGHLLHTYTIDGLVWTSTCWLVIRLVRTGSQRLWLAIGLVLGVGALTRYLVPLLVIALLAGLLVTGPRTVLRSRYLLGGVAIAAVLAVPTVAWQAANGWPELSMAYSLFNIEDPVSFLVGQFYNIGPLLIPVWIVGLVALVRRREWRRYRFLAVAWLVVLGVLLAFGTQAIYMTGILTVMLAVGCVVVAEWAATAAKRAVVGVALVGNALIAAVLMLPLMPMELYVRNPVLEGLGMAVLDQSDWPRQLAARTAEVYGTLPPTERERTVLLGENFSQAGALDRFGPEYGLPTAYSGHNSYADFGVPTDDKTVVIAFGAERDKLAPLFGSCDARGTFDYPYARLDRGKEFLVCHNPVAPWSQLWPKIRWIGAF